MRTGMEENTGLSRQRMWQLRKRAEGKCQTCGKPVNVPGGTAMHCPVHAKAARKHARKYSRKKGAVPQSICGLGRKLKDAEE